MSHFGKNVSECLSICKGIIESDLNKLLNTKIEISFVDESAGRCELYSDFRDIMDFIDEKNMYINLYKESPELLQVDNKNNAKIYKLKFGSLRSNCRVTHQPDFGDVFIYYKSNKHILEESLVKYLVSFRSEYHFHEECCEMIFKRLYDILDSEDELFLCCLYTRRGGIDICPARWSKNFAPKFVNDLLDVTKFARNGLKQ